MYNRAGWPHAEILDDIYRSATFTGGEKKSLIIGTDSVRFNANNFELAVLDKKLPFRVSTTAYETELNPLLRVLDSAAYFVYKEGGEPVSPFNTLAADVLQDGSLLLGLLAGADDHFALLESTGTGHWAAPIRSV